MTRIQLGLLSMLVAVSLLWLSARVFSVRVVNLADDGTGRSYRFGPASVVLAGCAGAFSLLATWLIARAPIRFWRVFAVMPFAVGVLLVAVVIDGSTAHMDIRKDSIEVPLAGLVRRPHVRMKLANIRAVTIRERASDNRDRERTADVVFDLRDGNQVVAPAGDLWRKAVGDVEQVLAARDIPFVDMR